MSVFRLRGRGRLLAVGPSFQPVLASLDRPYAAADGKAEMPANATRPAEPHAVPLSRSRTQPLWLGRLQQREPPPIPHALYVPALCGSGSSHAEQRGDHHHCCRICAGFAGRGWGRAHLCVGFRVSQCCGPRQVDSHCRGCTAVQTRRSSEEGRRRRGSNPTTAHFECELAMPSAPGDGAQRARHFALSLAATVHRHNRIVARTGCVIQRLGIWRGFRQFKRRG